MLYLGLVKNKFSNSVLFEGRLPIKNFNTGDIIELNLPTMNLIVKIINIDEDDYGFWAESADFHIRIDNRFFDVSPH